MNIKCSLLLVLKNVLEFKWINKKYCIHDWKLEQGDKMREDINEICKESVN